MATRSPSPISAPVTAHDLPREIKATITGFLITSERLLAIASLNREWRSTLDHPLAWETTVLYEDEIVDHSNEYGAVMCEEPRGRITMGLVSHLLKWWTVFNAPRKLVIYGANMEQYGEAMFTSLLSSGALSRLNHLVVGFLSRQDLLVLGHGHPPTLLRLHDFLASLTHLSSLTFFTCNLSRLQVPPLPSLLDLTLYSCHVRDMTGIDGLASLKRLRIRYCRGFHDLDITLPHSLQHVMCEGPGAPEITPFTRSLVTLPAVRSLQCCYSCPWDDALNLAAQQTQSWSEVVCFNSQEGSLMRESAVCALAAKCPKLESVKLDTSLPVAGMRHFAGFASLVKLRLYVLDMSDDHLRVLTRLPHLRKLVVDSAADDVTTASFETFAQMRALRSLRLHRCQGIMSLEGVEKCTNLEKFAFSPLPDGYCAALSSRSSRNSANDNSDDSSDDDIYNTHCDGNVIPYRLHADDARAISRLSGLRVLKLLVAPDEEGVRYLSTMQNITKLIIRTDPLLAGNREDEEYWPQFSYAQVLHVLHGFPRFFSMVHLYGRVMERGVDLYVEGVFSELRRTIAH